MPLILGTNSIKDTGFNVANSLRFNIGSSDNLTRTLGTATNGKKFTISVWTKLIEDPSGNAQEIMAGGSDGSNETFLRYNSNETISFRHDHASGTNWHIKTNRLFRDPTAWFHIVATFDSTQGTDSNRAKIYINGVQETSLATSDYPAQNEETFLNVNAGVSIGKTNHANEGYIGGYMSEFVFIDGQALDPTSFGEFDEDSPNIWKPKSVSALTFGTNGFYLDFENSGSLGNDKAGSNNFTVNNLTAIDQSTDTCTNNFCTLNPLTLQDTDFVLSEGNLKISIGCNNERKAVLGTFGLTSGKWYWEVKYTSTTGPSYAQIGISDIIEGTEASSENGKMGYFPYDYGYRGEHSSGNGLKTNNGSFTSYGDGWTTGDIIGVALDLDNNAIYFSKNGTWQASGDPTSGASKTNAAFNITDPSSTGTGAYFPAIGKEAADDPVFEFNFGGTQSFTISSGNADGNGYGNFEYAVPSGYYSLNTKNLAEYG
mgnify:CR=1 FL=1